MLETFGPYVSNIHFPLSWVLLWRHGLVRRLQVRKVYIRTNASWGLFQYIPIVPACGNAYFEVYVIFPVHRVSLGFPALFPDTYFFVKSGVVDRHFYFPFNGRW